MLYFKSKRASYLGSTMCIIDEEKKKLFNKKCIIQGSLSSLSNSIAAKIRGEYNNDNINSNNTFYKMGYEYFFCYYFFIITRPKGYI